MRKTKTKLFYSLMSALAVVVATITVGLVSLSRPTMTAAATGTPVIFFSPHQDDETLSMGASIIAHLNAGRPVYVVIVGDGTATGARGGICSKTGYCLTPQQIGAARDLEAKDAITRLGVPAANIFFEDVPETFITLRAAHNVLQKYIDDARFGKTASYVTMSWLDSLPDHYNLGYALNSRCIAHGSVAAELRDCRFYQSALYQSGSTLAGFDKVVTPGGGPYTMTTSADQQRLLNAAAAYSVWDPANGRYAVGGTYSVPEQFAYLKTHLRSLYHLPSSSLTDAAKALAESNFIFKYQFTKDRAQ